MDEFRDNLCPIATTEPKSSVCCMISVPKQVRSIINEVPEKFRALFTVAALTGLRIGEVLALQWKHVDFENRTLRIVQSLWYGELVEPKTKASNRTVLFGELLAKVLTRHLEQSSRIGPNDFVFCDSDGVPLNPDVLRRDVLYPAIERLRLPRLSRSAGFHAFRHSAASFINAQTGNLKLAQRLLGHSETWSELQIVKPGKLNKKSRFAAAPEYAREDSNL